MYEAVANCKWNMDLLNTYTWIIFNVDSSKMCYMFEDSCVAQVETSISRCDSVYVVVESQSTKSCKTWGSQNSVEYERVLMTNEMHNSYNQFYSTLFCLLYMFRTNLVVHHQEHCLVYCITQFGTIVQASVVASS